MRPTDDPSRSLHDRLRGRLAALGWPRGPRSTWAAVGVACLVAGVLWAALARIGGDHSQFEWLYEAQSIPRNGAARIVSALRSADIPCIESAGRIGVPASRRSEALDVLARNKLGPRDLDEILDDSVASGSIWEGPEDRVRRERRAQARVAREIISELPGVAGASVILNPVETGRRLTPTTRLKATAIVQTQSGQPLSRATVEMIRNVLTNIHDVDPNDVTLFDPFTGREYLVAGRPDIEAQASTRGLEEEYREKIRDNLRIDGAVIWVRLESPPAPVAPLPAHSTSEAPRANQPIGSVGPAGDPPTPLAVNQTSQVSESPLQTQTARDSSLKRDAGEEIATVLVRVPRSHYLALFHESQPDTPPTPERLASIEARVHNTIRTVVHSIIPASRIASLTIDRFNDTEPRPTSTESRVRVLPPVSTWLPVACGVGLAIVLLAALAGGWLAGRRAAPALKPTLRGPHSAVMTATPRTGADSDLLLREFIRRDPQSAAASLHRWILQGETH